MKKPIILALVAVCAVLLAQMLKAGDILSQEDALKKLHAGALLIDVRTTEEFKSNSLSSVINIPLDVIKTGITNYVTNKSQVILLHCRSGRRSGIAEEELRSLGYTNTFNIGSFEQAKKVVGQAGR
jgi:phage shock protein E